MNLKFFTLFAFLLSFTIACQQNSDTNTEGSESQEQVPEQNEQSPRQNQQAPNARQQATEVGNVSDEELQRFMAASQKVQVISQQIQQEMLAAVEEEGLEGQRYGEIQQSQQDPNAESNATAEEMENFQAATKEIQSIQTKAQQQMEEQLAEVGLTEQRYQEITMMIQSDPKLQQKFQMMQQGQN